MKPIVVDLETSGLDKVQCGIWQIGAVDLNDGEEFLEEGRIEKEDAVEEGALKVIGKSEKELRDETKQSQKELVDKFFKWVETRNVRNLLCQNPQFDITFLELKAIKYNLKKDISIEYLSTVQLNMYKSSIRLNSMVKYSDGFKLAEIDLKLRGPGDIFGTKQSGLPDLIFVDIVNDTDIIEDAKHIAFKLIKDDIKLEKEKNNIIRQQLKNNYSSHFFYSKIA